MPHSLAAKDAARVARASCKEEIVNHHIARTILCVSILVSFCLDSAVSEAGRPRKRPPPLVSVAKVVEREVRSRLSAVGSVAPYRRSVVSSELEGRVQSAPLQVGDFVRANKTILATVRRSGLQIDLRILRAELEKARQDLLRLERGKRPEEIAALQAKVREREAQMRNNELELNRARDLYEKKILDKASFDRAEAAYEASWQLYEEASRNLEIARLGPREEEKARAKAEVDRVRARIARLRDDLAKTKIRSPLTGFVTQEWVEVGQWLTKGGRVAEVIELDRVLVQAPIAERRISLVRVGDEARVVIDALGGRTFKGRVRGVIPQADPKSRTFPVEVEIKNTKSYDLKAGMFARLSLEYGKAARMVLVPKDALILRARGPSVFVFEKGRVREVSFVQGVSVDSFVEDAGGVLKAGTQVVVKGNENLRAGMPVRLKGQGGRPAWGRGGVPRGGGSRRGGKPAANSAPKRKAGG